MQRLAFSVMNLALSVCVEESNQSRPGCKWLISPNDDCYLNPTLHWPSCNPSLEQRKFKPWSILLAPNSGWEDGATDSGTQRQRYLSPPQWHHQENPTGSTEYSLGENSFRPPHHTSSINNLGDKCKKRSSLGESTITEHTPLPITTGILLLLLNVFLYCMLKSAELSRFQRYGKVWIIGYIFRNIKDIRCWQWNWALADRHPHSQSHSNVRGWEDYARWLWQNALGSMREFHWSDFNMAFVSHLSPYWVWQTCMMEPAGRTKPIHIFLWLEGIVRRIWGQ